MNKTLAAASFFSKAKQLHGETTYDYSATVYVRGEDRVIIVCRIHGPFSQVAEKHKRGSGCPDCGRAQGAQTKTLSLQQFIERSRLAHGPKYDYSRAAYAGATDKVVIICPRHGPFEQRAYAHMGGQGCGECRAFGRPITTKAFVARARAAHGETYDYSLADCVGAHRQVSIICKEHGIFEQIANNHLSGHGCPACRAAMIGQAWAEQAKGRPAALYLIRLFDKQESFYKVGVTFQQVQKRYAKSRDLLGYEYEIIAVHKSLNAHAVAEWEQSILATFAHLSYKPNRAIPGLTECFVSCEEIMQCFPL